MIQVISYSSKILACYLKINIGLVSARQFTSVLLHVAELTASGEKYSCNCQYFCVGQEVGCHTILSCLSRGRTHNILSLYTETTQFLIAYKELGH